MTLKFKRVVEHAKAPVRATKNAAAYDVFSTVAGTIRPNNRAAIPVGIALEIPEGYAALVCPRSGLARKLGVTVLNAPGVIDSDFRGEVNVLVINHDETDYNLDIGDRIGQLLFVKAEDVEFVEYDELSATDRGEGGFGHTGK